MKNIFLKPGREKSVLRKHPWIFAGAIATREGNPEPGETVRVVHSDGRFLAWGSWSKVSQISVRLWSWEEGVVPGESLIDSRIRSAISLREQLGIMDQSDACRLIFSESDGIPGLIADRFGDYVVCQFSSAGAEFWKSAIVESLARATGCRGIFERSDLAVRRKEGLRESSGLLWGEQPPEWVVISEQGRKFRVSITEGHKTGYYLDQRDNHALLASISREKKVLDCFSYTGGFGVAALTGGASRVTFIDSSAPALDSALANVGMNGFTDRFECREGDVFRELRGYKEAGERFDIVVLDPPKFIESQQHVEKGARAYKDINLQGIRILNPGGILLTFSCSGHMDEMLFRKVVADAALDAGRELRFVKWLHQAGDHPVISSFPEGSYLKGMMAIAT